MTTNNIDATKLNKYVVVGGDPAQLHATKLNKYIIFTPGASTPPVRARRHVTVTRKTVAD